MRETAKERFIKTCRRWMRQHTWLKGPVTVLLVVVLFIMHLWEKITHNTKRLVSLAVLSIFFVISCSFCGGIFAESEEVSAVNTITEFQVMHLSEVEQDLAAEEEVLQTFENLHEDEPQNHEAEEGGDDLETYSIEQILADNETFDEPDSAESNAFEDVSPDDWNLILVNKQHPIPEGYEFTLGTITGSLQCDARIIPDLMNMLKKAREDNISLVICSPYRSEERQIMLFDRKINRYMSVGYSYMESYKLASQVVTLPGSSEHQLGLSLDIYTNSYMSLDEGFGDTKAGIWLQNHCAEFGFILRYPKGKEMYTGIDYEPWHFRYVGKTAAKEIMGQGISLEEYIDLISR